MKIALIKYNAGNIQSVIYALNRLGVDPVLSDNPDELHSADKIIFPGVGEAKSTMKHLKAKGLDVVIPKLTQPVLGICLGMQLLCHHSEENDTDCLNVFDIKVKRFSARNLKVPHMGWNVVQGEHAPFDESGWFYFVHSFVCEPEDRSLTVGWAEYGGPICAAVRSGNVLACQFHPEKSQGRGHALLRYFLQHFEAP